MSRLALRSIGLATPDAQNAIVQQLLAAGLVNATDAANFPGGREPPASSRVCRRARLPQLPQPFYSAPGSGNGATTRTRAASRCTPRNNDTSDTNSKPSTKPSTAIAGASGLPRVEDEHVHHASGDLGIDHDTILAAPILHDWPKSIVSSGTRTAASSPSSTSAATARPTPGRGRRFAHRRPSHPEPGRGDGARASRRWR